MPQTPKLPAAPHGSVELTPPCTPVTPGTSRASFFPNLGHSYVAGNYILSSRNEMSTKSLHSIPIQEDTLDVM